MLNTTVNFTSDGPTVTVTTQPVPQQPYPVHGGPPQAGYGSPYPPSMPMPHQPQQGM